MSDDESPVAPNGGNQNAAPARAAPAHQPLGLGDFDTEDAETWLDRAEMLFTCRSITDSKKKAALIMEAFTKEMWQIMRPWIKSNAPVEYDALKEELLELYTTSTSTRAKKFFEAYNTSIGDRKPSHLYNYLKELITLPKTTTRAETELDVVMECVLSSLPPMVRAGLPDHVTTPHKDFMKIADQLALTYNSQRELLAAAATTDKQKEGEVLYDSEEDTAAPLRPTPTSHSRDTRRYKGGNSGTHQQKWKKQQFPGQQQQQKITNRPDICYFHRRFGRNAWNCEKPCSWQTKNVF